MRINIFKSSTIQHAFQKTNMWPVNADLCIKQFKTYSYKFCKKVKKSVKNNSNHFSLSQLFYKIHSQIFSNVKHVLMHEWKSKIQ